MTHTRARSVLGMVSNPSLQVLGKDLPWSRMVLDKDFNSSLQGPRQGLTPEPAVCWTRFQTRAYKS